MSNQRAFWINSIPGVLAVLASGHFAFAQSNDAAEAVAKCAALAASNAEAGVTSFVTTKDIRPSVALEPCRLAAEKDPSDLRTRYRLSRAQYADHDMKGAFESARTAAEGGYGPAMYNLAVMYLNGEGIDKDQTKAMAWMLKAAEHLQELTPPFLIQLYTALAESYVAGTGTSKDMSAAVKWYEHAAALNDSGAMAQLGYYYQMGIGTAKDEKRAAGYTLRAAQAGSCTAAFNAGVNYYNGQGVPTDKQEAKRWLSKAKECPNATEERIKSSNQLIDRINKEATPQELTTGEKLAVGAGAVIGGILLYNKLKGPETAAIYLENSCTDPARFVVRYFDRQWKFASLNLKPGQRDYVVDGAGKRITHEIDHAFFTSGDGGKHHWGGKLPFQNANSTLYMEEKKAKPDKDGALVVEFLCSNSGSDDDGWPF